VEQTMTRARMTRMVNVMSEELHQEMHTAEGRAPILYRCAFHDPKPFIEAARQLLPHLLRKHEELNEKVRVFTGSPVEALTAERPNGN
jgi:hypothetical protein